MKYEPRLDGLRFIAIMMVMIEHFVYFIGSKFSGGFYGVNLFFVLSGFLITSILIRETNNEFIQSYKKFLGRRVLRIFPIYYFILLILIILKVGDIRNDVSYLLSYTYNYRLGATHDWGNIYSAYWSLSVEEQFYIFFPIIALLFRRRLKILTLICALFVFTAFLQVGFDIFDLSKYNYVGLLTNMAPLSLGAIGAIYVNRKLSTPGFFSSMAVEIGILILLMLTLHSRNWMLKSITIPIFNLFIVLKAGSFGFAIKPINNFLQKKWIVFIGRISYGMYLYHGIVSYFFVKNFFNPFWEKLPFPTEGLISKFYYNDWLLRFPLLCLLTVLISWLSFRFIENPILSLKDKFFKY